MHTRFLLHFVIHYLANLVKLANNYNESFFTVPSTIERCITRGKKITFNKLGLKKYSLHSYLNILLKI